MSVRTLVFAAATAAFSAGATQAQVAPSMTPAAGNPTATVGSLTRYKVRDGVYMYSTDAANTVIQVGDDGVVVIDPQGGAAAKDLLADIARLSDKPIHWVINTSGDPEHLAGNQEVASAGTRIEGGNTRSAVIYGEGGANIWAHEGVLTRLSEAGGDPNGWPTDSYFVAEQDMFINGEAVKLLHPPAAHTAGDSFVVLDRNDVIVAGDVYTPDRYPSIDLANGGSINGLIGGLNQLIRLAVPAFNLEGGTLILPAHGRISDESDVAEYRDMVTIIRDRVAALIEQGATLAQVQAARPSADYDPRYGQAAGARFVEQIYRSLSENGGQP